MPFAVLMVCTGNVCRSPAAQRLLTARLTAMAAPPAGVTVASAGLRALTGRGIDPPTAAALREQGIDPDGHVARLVTQPMLRSADLVLTAESAQRAVILQAEPSAMRRTFTMREFARLGAHLPEPGEAAYAISGGAAGEDGDALRRRVAQVAAQRGLVDPPGPGGDDVGDPFGAPPEIARAVVEQLARTVDGILASLAL